MIKVTEIKTLQDFENLKVGDKVFCEFKNDVIEYLGRSKILRHKSRFFTIDNILEHSKEIILDKKSNIYFNYDLFLNEEKGISNLKNMIKIDVIKDSEDGE
jgi:hypothetical protein